MIDDKKIEEAAYRFAISQEHGELLALIDGYKEGYKDAINELLKSLWHPVSENPDMYKGLVFAYSRENFYRNTYNLPDILCKTTCSSFQEMWELEVKAYHLTKWLYTKELFDLIIKVGE